MNTAQPIKDLQELERFKRYYLEVRPNMRNYVLLILGLNTALRVSDLLALQWRQVYDFTSGTLRMHMCLVEQKTGKHSQIYLNAFPAKNVWLSCLQARRTPCIADGCV